ncbi:TPM domain-containing protein [Leptospira ilyithenensis]|uniref:TPM domain-containing protein n=1 Tax=Leptospira ilyithenensis TaxID=2484901 RepID=A0A4R9LTD4_9LEPT|nr:TPM domain-containing protein [Leptospira ilyithenensis]TGN10413.1 TPM domain-containing protein [Leptospira ilyithenensis]
MSSICSLNLFRSLLLFVALSQSLFGDSLKEQISKLPNPRLTNGWVLDQVGYLNDSGAISELNERISRSEAETQVEIAIVVLQSVGDNSPKEFATALFETWGIGKKGKDNGILFLHVVDQRRLEIETGYGMESILTDIKCKRILDELVIPEFKKENFSLGMIKGLSGIQRGIKNPEIGLSDLVTEQEEFFPYMDQPISHYIQPTENTISGENKGMGIFKRILFEPKQSVKEFFIFFLSLGMIAVWFLFGGLLSILPFGNQSIYKVYSYFGKYFSWVSGITAGFSLLPAELSGSDTFFSVLNLIPIGFILYFGNRKIENRLRNNPRNCPSCSKKMQKLNETKDNAYLSPGEITEEKIYSVDYDIWNCKECDVQIKERYTGHLPASLCKKCHYQTFRCISVTVKRKADYDAGGLEIHHYECAHCKLTENRQVHTAKLSRSSSGKSGGGYSSSGSGGSWGGGSSGGGGAGSSY